MIITFKAEIPKDEDLPEFDPAKFTPGKYFLLFIVFTEPACPSLTHSLNHSHSLIHIYIWTQLLLLCE